MLPKVTRKDFFATELAEAAQDNCNELNDFKLRMMSAIGTRGQGRRAMSTKSAHLTPVPLDASFISPEEQHKLGSNNLKPYFPYSAKVNSPIRQSRVQRQQHQQESSLWKWRTEQNGYKSEYSYSRLRAHSQRGSAKGENEVAKPMPYLVPKTAHGARPTARKVVTVPEKQAPVAVDPGRNRAEKVVKAKPLSAAPPANTSGSATQQEKDLPNLKGQVEEMVMTGSGKGPGIVNTSVSIGNSKVQATRERVQICRTNEEREKNPETIRVDKSGIRVFPDIGGGESVTLKLLSLQHNLITRLENVPLLSQLVVLDLYDNRVERISGLQGLPSLRVLLLGKNRIKRIEGLESLKKLEILDLHGNQLRYVDNLGPLTSLRVLNLAGNLLRNIRNLGPYGMSSLTELNLKRNRIKNLEGLQKAPHLKRLLIANNDLQTISCLAPLRKLMYLRELVVDPNPLISSASVGPEYRNQILTLFPNLSSLDRNSVSEEMKNEAKAWHRKKLAEEEARQQEEARPRDEMISKIGPPGSREQVIYQARRRWESVKNYVKNTNDTTSTATIKSPQKKLKNLKSVVSVATGEKKLSPEALYPPSTLDLEVFPDGHAELDQTESFMSANAKNVPSDNVEKNPGLGRIEEGGGNEDQSSLQTAQTPIFLTSASLLEPAQNTHESQLAPLPTITASYCPSGENGKRADEVESNLGDEKKFEVTSSLSNIEPAEILIENSATVANDQSSPSVEIFTKLDNAETESVLLKESTEQNYCNINPVRSPFEVLSPPTSGDREKSAKVAVVRPLVRGISCNEKDNNSCVSSQVGEQFAQSQHDISDRQMATNLIEHAGLAVSSQLQFPTPAIKENCKGEKLTEECQPCESKTGGIENASDKNSEQFISENAAKTVESGETTSATAPPPQNSNSENKRAKLLKHLRSISLDSYPHQFFTQPGKEKAEDEADESILQLSDDNDNGEEEDDDNDNEVQDYDCDDAYSIATSTTTTGSTPRRSSTVMVTTNRLLRGGGSCRKQTFPRTRSQRIKIRDRVAKLQQTSNDTSRSPSTIGTGRRINSGTGSRGTEGTIMARSASGSNAKILRRCDSAISLSTGSGAGSGSLVSSSTLLGGNSQTKMIAVPIGGSAGTGTGNEVEHRDGTTSLRKQGVDFLVEIEGKVLNVFGQGGLRHALTAFTPNLTCHVCTAKFHYISYDSIIPFFGKLRQIFPSLEHFHFRANNICSLAQLDALSDLQGLTSLCIAKEGNPIVSHESWAHYASYRLSHWGLQVINGKEVCSEYRGGVTPTIQAKNFESLGFLALSCLPQTALTPLAKRLHMLHCFCCCSPSSSSDESNPKGSLPSTPHITEATADPTAPTQTEHGSAGNFCTAWDDDPVLLDVIGKEALVYCPPPLPHEDDEEHFNSFKREGAGAGAKEVEVKLGSSNSSNPSNELSPTASQERRRAETLGDLIHSGVEIVEKVDRLEKVWPTLMKEVIQEMLMDFRFMDSYMKKELKKAQDITIINQQQYGGHNQPLQYRRKSNNERH